MDKKKSLLNVFVSIICQIFVLIASFLNRRFLIEILGDGPNGLNSLFTSIIGVLSVAELGVGGAIVFSMYKPIVDNDTEKINALYNLYKKIYLIIGCVILGCGLLITPILPFLAADYVALDVNIYLTFILMLVSVSLTYFYNAKISLINAYKNNFVTTAINCFTVIIRDSVQILILFTTKSFTFYCLWRIFAVLLEMFLIEVFTRKKYKNVIFGKNVVDKETKGEIVKNIKAMFMHKMGGVLVNTADSIIISAFIGVVVLSRYSNYTVISSAVSGVISLFFVPLTSSIGHLCVKKDKVEINKYYNFFFSFNFIVGVIFFFGYYAIVDNLVTICFGENLEMSKAISFIITVNQFVQFLRQSTLLFRDATGTFYHDRWKPLFESIVNVSLSILLVIILPNELKVVGVIAATIITNLTICHTVEPYVLFKHVFELSPSKHYWRRYIYVIFFICFLIGLNFSMVSIDNVWLELLINGLISVGFSLILSLIIFIIDTDFRKQIIYFAKKIFKNK